VSLESSARAKAARFSPPRAGTASPSNWHADELEGSGGAELAAELGRVSADHLAAVSDAGIKALAASATVAGAAAGDDDLFSATDTGAGASPHRGGSGRRAGHRLQPRHVADDQPAAVMALGVSQLGLRHAEVVTAVTINAACRPGTRADRGQIAAGCVADLVVAAVDDWREVAYWMGQMS